MKYTVHKPGSNLAESRDAGTELRPHKEVVHYAGLEAALEQAYTYLPLDTPGRYNPAGGYVTVQEWDETGTPLRTWIISGRMAGSA